MTKPNAASAPLDGIAPYPRTPEEATADAMIKHYAAFGLMHDRIGLSETAEQTHAQFRESVGHVVAAFNFVYLLAALKQRDPAGADKAAAELWLHQVSGDQSAYLWEWLTEYGIDPEAVVDIAAEVEQRRREKFAAASGSPA